MKKSDLVAGYAMSRFYSLRLGRTKKLNRQRGNSQEAQSEQEELLSGSSLTFSWPEEFGEQLLFVISFPLLFCMKYTIPDVKYEGIRPMLNGYIFLFTFIGSIIDVRYMFLNTAV